MRIARQPIIIRLMLIYGFLLPFGNLIRIGGEQERYGVPTLILLTITLTSLDINIKALINVRLFAIIGSLILWMMMASVLSFDPLSTFTRTTSIWIYLLAAAAAYTYFRAENDILKLMFAFCFGGLISSTLTIIDFYGILSIPGVNENLITTKTESGRIEQASGAFTNRTSMAAYLTMIVTGGFMASLLLRHLSPVVRIILALSSFACSYAMLLTHNRSGFISAAMAIFITLVGSSMNFKRTVTVITMFCFIIYMTYWIVLTYSPGVLMAYQSLLGLGTYSTYTDQVFQSDLMRLELAKHAFYSLLQNPIGNGYSLIHDLPNYEYRLFDPHSLVTQILWGAGGFGLFWLIFVIYKGGQTLYSLVHHKSVGIFHPTAVTISSVILSFLIFNITHTVLSGLFWVFLGIIHRLAVSQNSQAKTSDLI